MIRVKLVLITTAFLFFLGDAVHCNLVSIADTKSDKPVFEASGALLKPESYRQWIFVGSSLGLSYAKNPGQTTGAQLYHNVYINPSSYFEFAKTGKFPDGTMMILELASQEEKKEPGLQGSFEKEIVGLEASVKDSTRFKEAWAYFNFTGANGKFLPRAKAFPKEACWACHDVNAQTDHVFTQFYPILREVAPKQ